MGVSPRANSISKDIGCELSVNNRSWEKSSVEHEERICCYMKEIAEITPQGAHSISPVNLKDALIMQEVGIALGALHDEDLGEHPSDEGSTFGQDDVLGSEEIKECQELRHPISLDAKKQKGLGKSATFPCAAKVLSFTSSVDGSDGASITALQVQCLSTCESPAYARSFSLPASVRLVSAMKGGRAQNGMSPTSELHVKWAPDVYDPPDTSMSHTVKKNHYQRSKAKKKDKHRHKARSSRGSGSEKKHSNRSNTGNMPDAMDMRLPSAGDKLRADGYGKSKAEVLDYAVGGQESTCGSSFLREALAKVHLSITEAS